ncbi:MAG: SDR family oxidoreductase [Verrucomicrobium sp.]|nr:SDR family oxidoreductase [Verrucomicrobium sp.]
MSGRAVITGGAGHLARAAAHELEAAGWHVDRPGREALDVLEENSVDAYFSARPEPLDLLIANAGVIDDRPVPSLTEASWDRVVGTNLRGAFLCARAALPLLRAARGQILFLGSRSARSGPAGQAAYAAAKAGLIGFSQSLAREWGPEGIRCNVVLPGFLETRMTDSLTPEARHRALEDHALGRFNTPEEAARGLALLATLKNVSGQVFQFDSRVDRWS